MTLFARLYGLPHCSTCQKAIAFLEGQGVVCSPLHDVKTQPLSLETITALADAVGGSETLFSKRALKYRSLGLHERSLCDAERLSLMHEEYTFIKRPVVVFEGGSTFCGFSEKTLMAYLNAQKQGG